MNLINTDMKKPNDWLKDVYYDAESGDWERFDVEDAMQGYAEYYASQSQGISWEKLWGIFKEGNDCAKIPEDSYEIVEKDFNNYLSDFASEQP